MDTRGKTILVAGATGQQGGATARHLIAAGWPVRALTRNPDKPEAQALADQGAEVVRGDLNDPASLQPALSGVYGVFSVQNFWEAGVEREVRQGKNLADAAHAAGVEHVVYTSVGSAGRNTGIPHFESKWEIEQHIHTLGLPATILRPATFMDNFNTVNAPAQQDGTLTFSMALPPHRTMQMIAVDDIGAFAALAFARPGEFKGHTLELAGDELTMAQVAGLLSEAMGETVRYVEQPIEQVRRFNPEVAIMFEWFNEQGYEADISALRALYPALKTFETWLKETRVTENIQ